MTLTPPQTYWRKCSSCKKEIPFGKIYQRCSVSTCNARKTDYVFCSVACWDAHLGVENHRESSADENRAPTQQEFERQVQKEKTMTTEAPKRIIVRESSHPIPSASDIETDVLVVVSKVKKLIRDASEFNTSQCAVDELTEIVKKECLRAIENAKTAGRKTVMGRDF